MAGEWHHGHDQTEGVDDVEHRSRDPWKSARSRAGSGGSLCATGSRTTSITARVNLAAGPIARMPATVTKPLILGPIWLNVLSRYRFSRRKRQLPPLDPQPDRRTYRTNSKEHRTDHDGPKSTHALPPGRGCRRLVRSAWVDRRSVRWRCRR